MKERLIEQFFWILYRWGFVQIQIPAANNGEQIVVTPRLPYFLISVLAHELGHIIGTRLSFKAGEVLTPNEVKNTTIHFPQYVVMYLIGAYFQDEIEITDEIIEFVAQILDVYTKGNIDCREIDVIPISAKELVELAMQSTSNTFVVQDGDPAFLSTKLGRNEELAAIATAKAVETIIQNSSPYILRILFKIFHLTNSSAYGKISSHSRANRIVQRAYRSKGWIIPSEKDLQMHENL